MNTPTRHIMKIKLLLLILLFATPCFAGDRNHTQFGKDTSTGSILAIGYAHHEIHEGNSFVAGSSGILANEASLKISFRTPDTDKWSHFNYAAACSLDATLTFTENPTVTVNTGSALPIYNNNRNSTNTSILLGSSTGVYVANSLTLGATMSGGTSIKPVVHLGSGKKTGGGASSFTEAVLKQNEDYSVVLTSEAADNHCFLEIYEYEHTN